MTSHSHAPITCLAARRALYTDPTRLPAAIEAHIAHCPACSRLASEVRGLDAGLRALASEEAAPPSPRSSRPLMPSRRALIAGGGMAAAAALGGVALVRVLAPTPSLAAEVVSHISPNSLSARPPVGEQAVMAALYRAEASAAAQNLPPAVTYANNCAIQGETAAHLVVATAKEPVSLFLMPKIDVPQPVAVAEGPWAGVIDRLPAGGSFAALASTRESALAIAALLRG